MNDSRKVLIVEDDSATQALLRRITAREGLQVFAAEDGDQAIGLMRRHPMSAVVLDLLLPRTNGFEVIRHMKCLMPHMLGRTIVVTSASESLTRNCEELDLVWGFRRKPVDLTELAQDIVRCAGGVARRKAPASAPLRLVRDREQRRAG